MIRIELRPRLLKRADQLGDEITAKIEAALTALANDFGKPHQHLGLGIRKLTRNIYEVRVHLHWRIVLLKEKDRLIAHDVMNHDEVRAWLKAK
jgi:hypothetical protein